MSKKSIIKFTLDLDNPPEWDPEDLAFVQAMTDEEAYQNALDDPDNPPMTEAERGTFRRVPNVREIREGLGMSQLEFAASFGLNPADVRDWEERRAFPNQAARSYLRVIAAIPAQVQSALKAPSVR